jgi:uncharacterized membrane protein YbhN (UPF0104 family)
MEAASTARPRPARVRAAVFRTGVGLCAGAILIVAFLKLVGVDAVFRRLEHLSIGFALLSGVAFLAAYAVRAMRWRCLLRPCEVSVRRAVAIYQVATFLNWLLPVRGGELAKSLLLRRSDGIAVSRSLATVSMDKAMDLLPALVLLSLLPFVRLHLSRPLWVLLLSAMVAVGIGVLVLALAAWRRECALAVLAFQAVGVSISVPVVLYGYTFYNLAFILPTPPGQVGSNELVGLLIFSGVFGLDRSGVGAMFLFSHPWTAVLMTASGLLCLSVMGLSLRHTLRLAQESKESAPA